MKATVEHEGSTVTAETNAVTIEEWVDVFKGICLAHGFALENVTEAFGDIQEDDTND